MNVKTCIIKKGLLIYLNYKVFSVDSIFIDEDVMSVITEDLSKALPQLKMKDYFRVKPKVLNTSDYVTFAQNNENEFIGVLASKIYTLSVISFLHVTTIFIGNKYQGTRLFNHLWHSHFREILQINRDLPQAIVLKTYNPISYSLISKVSKRANSIFYPELSTNIAYSDNIQKQVKEIAETIDPDSIFNFQTGVFKNGAGNVPSDFYPNLPRIACKATMDYFNQYLIPSDRLLCCLFCEDFETQEKVINQFKVYRN